MCNRSELEYFVKTMIKGADYRIQIVSESYGASFICMIETLDIKRETIQQCLEIMGEEIFADEVKFSHVLVHMRELDKYCKLKKYLWYSHDMLIEIIVNILWKVDFIPPISLQKCSLH